MKKSAGLYLVGISCLLFSAQGFSAIVNVGSIGLSAMVSGATSYSVSKGALVGNGTTVGNAIQINGLASMFPVEVSIASTGSLKAGDSMTAQATGDYVNVSAPHANWAAVASFDTGAGASCYYDSMMGPTAAFVLTGLPSAVQAGGLNTCTISYAEVSSGTSCPTSAGAYSNTLDCNLASSFQFGTGDRVCLLLGALTWHYGDDAVTEVTDYQSQQESTDPGVWWCDMDAMNNPTWGHT